MGFRSTKNVEKSVTYCHEVPLCIECRKYFFKYINAVKNLCNTTNTNRGGARGGLGGYSPSSEHASPRRKVKSDFVGDFWHL